MVVPGAGVHPDSVSGSLAAAGFEALVVRSVPEARSQVEAGALVMVIGTGGSEWAGPVSVPVLSMPPSLRRSCLVVLAGAGFATGDAWRALTLGVDAVVAASDLERLGEICAGALSAKRALVAPLDAAAAARLGG